jgi:hypothetical protein
MVQLGSSDFPRSYMRRVRTWMRAILLNHAQRYPYLAVADLYKLIYQAAMGNEHAVTDENRVRDLLRQEIVDLTAGPPEALVDPISADHRIVRIHLRPYVDLGLDQEVLVNAFIMTARHFPGSLNSLSEYARIALQLAQEGVLPFAPEQFSGYIADQRTNGFPPVHHSQLYTEKYRPAYRIVARETLPKELVK